MEDDESPLSTSVAPPFPDELENENETSLRGRLRRAGSWLADRSFRWRPAEEAPLPASGYLTLIPLSDARQTRDTHLTATFLLLFALAVGLLVFLSVPRSITTGEVHVRANRMSWNTTKSTYQLKLEVQLPIYNPNYLPFGTSVEGDIKVYFYSTEAGKKQLDPIALPPRQNPTMVEFSLDASDVPSDYILAILTQCSTFPEQLIFFLKGRLEAKHMFRRQRLPLVNTYFIVDCRE